MGGPDGLWKIRFTGYRPGQPWRLEGDPPGGPNCKVPSELIRTGAPTCASSRRCGDAQEKAGPLPMW